jgi:glycine/D-amino acid oxidase-like deaminating enzyme
MTATVGRALWQDQLSEAERAHLSPGVPDDLNRRPDVLVVGGGIIGVATAVACQRAGLGSVVVLERDHLAVGPSGGAAGLLIPEAHAHVDADVLVNLGRLSLAQWQDLERSWPGGLGLMELDWLEPDGQHYPQARINPLRAVARLATGLACVATGVEVTGVSIGSGQIQSVHTSAGDFTPGTVVFATGTPPRLEGLELHLPASEIKGHMLVSEPTSLVLPDSVAGYATSIDEGRILIGGTLDHGDAERVVRPEVIAGMWSELESAWAPAGGIRISHQWACFRPAHPDLLPVIDQIASLGNAWLTSGHYKTGIMMAPATGRALAEWIRTGQRPPEIVGLGIDRFAT